MWRISVLAACALVSTVAVRASDASPTTVCEVSRTVADRPPDDPSASTFASPGGTWYANTERTLWAWWWGRRHNGEYKVLWVRPRGVQVRVRGERLDGRPASLLQTFPATHSRATFTTSSLAFPGPGCWRVNASADNAELEFVVAIPSDSPRARLSYFLRILSIAFPLASSSTSLSR
jgi:hypothetical protein